MNFGNPQRPEIMGQFVGCILGMAEACRALDFPIVSGNVSLYNETKSEDGAGSAILPTPAIGGVGLIDDWRRSARLAFAQDGDDIWLIGDAPKHLGQSQWLRVIHGRDGRDAGPPPPVDLIAERRHGDAVRALIEAELVTAVHDVADGGLLVALAEMGLAGARGATLHKDLPETAGFLFGEDQARYIVTTDNSDPMLRRLAADRIRHLFLGSVGGDTLRLPGGAAVPLDAMRGAHEGFLPQLMRGEPAVA